MYSFKLYMKVQNIFKNLFPMKYSIFAVPKSYVPMIFSAFLFPI